MDTGSIVTPPQTTAAIPSDGSDGTAPSWGPILAQARLAARRWPASQKRLRLVIVVIADFVTLQAALWLGCALRLMVAPWRPIEIPDAQYESLAIGVGLLPAGLLLLGAYRLDALDSVERFRRRYSALSILFGTLLAWDYLVQSNGWSRGVLLATFTIAMAVMPFVPDAVRTALHRLDLWTGPVIIFGTDPVARALASHLRNSPEIGMRPVAFAVSPAGERSEQISHTIDGLPVVSASPDNAAALATLADTAIVSDAAPREALAMAFRDVIRLPQLTGATTQSVEAVSLGDLVGLRVRNNLLVRRNRIMKRILDLVIALPLMIVVAPALLVLALAIKMFSPGPAFFRQARRGLNGEVIHVLKLRTMHVDAERRLSELLAGDATVRARWEQYIKLDDDPRIIPVIGSLLRRTSLDELPQLLNVIRGDMSLVGPRPFPDYHLARFDAEFRSLRECVPPGITGLWQIRCRSNGDVERQHALDSHYIRNWSLWMDLYILFRTVCVVLSADGAK